MRRDPRGTPSRPHAARGRGACTRDRSARSPRAGPRAPRPRYPDRSPHRRRPCAHGGTPPAWRTGTAAARGRTAPGADAGRPRGTGGQRLRAGVARVDGTSRGGRSAAGSPTRRSRSSARRGRPLRTRAPGQRDRSEYAALDRPRGSARRPRKRAAPRSPGAGPLRSRGPACRDRAAGRLPRRGAAGLRAGSRSRLRTACGAAPPRPRPAAAAAQVRTRGCRGTRRGPATPRGPRSTGPPELRRPRSR